MLKKTITFVDFNGNQVSEDCYFHMNRREALKMAAKYGDLQEHAKQLAEDEDYEGIIEFFEALLLGGYGVRSKDGKSFIKSPEVKEKFEYSIAYAELFEELVQDPEELYKFASAMATHPEANPETQPTDRQEPKQDSLKVVSPEDDLKQREGESQEAYIKRLQKQLGKN